jgi:RNA 3'-phosphate cyclase
MIIIDGSQGEGGGQVLRSALTLSIITGKPAQIDSIRARRPKPGLMAQHLRAVQAAAAVGGARVEGAASGSTSLLFIPRAIAPGSFRFDIGTAGSTSLVLQTVLMPLSLASAPSRLVISGGTHVPWRPCFHYLQWQWRPAMQQIGFDFELDLERAGFYPQGGGRIHAAIRPATALAPLCRSRRGACQRISGISAVANLDLRIAERQQQRAIKALNHLEVPVDIDLLRLPAHARGTLLLLLAECQHSCICAYALGSRGKPAETVADEAVRELEGFLATGGAIDPYLADQLLLPLALTPGFSELHTVRVTEHLITNAAIIRQFLSSAITIEGAIGQPGMVRITGQTRPDRDHPRRCMGAAAET